MEADAVRSHTHRKIAPKWIPYAPPVDAAGLAGSSSAVLSMMDPSSPSSSPSPSSPSSFVYRRSTLGHPSVSRSAGAGTTSTTTGGIITSGHPPPIPPSSSSSSSSTSASSSSYYYYSSPTPSFYISPPSVTVPRSTIPIQPNTTTSTTTTSSSAGAPTTMGTYLGTIPPPAAATSRTRLTSASSNGSSSGGGANGSDGSSSSSSTAVAAAARKQQRPTAAKKKAWTMTVEVVREEPDGSRFDLRSKQHRRRIQDEDDDEEEEEEEDEEEAGYYLVTGVVADSVERPLTKEVTSGRDEDQQTGGVPGWWFLLATRHYRPLPAQPDKLPFPSSGKQRLTVDLWYGKEKVVSTHGFFNFDYKPLPPNAKIHVDWKHRHPRLSSSSSSQQSTPSGTTDYLFLRTTERYLTAVRLFVPYSTLRASSHLLEGWLTPKRIRKMEEHAEVGLAATDDDIEFPVPKAKRQRKEPTRSRATTRRSSGRAPKTHVDVEVDVEGDGDGDEDEYQFNENGRSTATKYSRTSRSKKSSDAPARTRKNTSNTKEKSTDLYSDQPFEKRNGVKSKKGAKTKDIVVHRDDDEEEGSGSDTSLGSEFGLLEIDPYKDDNPLYDSEQRQKQGETGDDANGYNARNGVDPTEGAVQEDREAEMQLEPAQAKDIFVYNSQSQGSQSRPDVEEINYGLIEVQEPKCIGSGSFAQVYRAKYEGRDIAVKVFKPSETATRIDNEIRILGKLRGHKNVVHVVGYSVVNDQKRIAMEFCALGNLHDCIHSIKQSCRRSVRATRRKTEKGKAFEATIRSSRRGRSAAAAASPGAAKRKRGDDTEEAEPVQEDPYSELRARRASIIAGIAEGMRHLHRNNVCHRDLSSMNVLVDGNWVPKIADFGLSTVDTLKMIGMGVGTSRWRAPEVYKNKPTKVKSQFKTFYTNSSDVYSFGIIVWELFHLGHLPWEGELDDDMRRKVMQGERPKIDADVPKVWRKLIEQCWAQDPERRPSFDTVLRYLHAHGLSSA